MVSGQRDRDHWELRFGLVGGAQETGIDKLWARRKIAALLDGLAEGADADAVRRKITELGIRHHLVSKYTSLVAVDVTPTAPPGVTAKTRPLPVNLPAGWSHEKVFGTLPGTATPAPLLQLARRQALFADQSVLEGPQRGLNGIEAGTVVVHALEKRYRIDR